MYYANLKTKETRWQPPPGFGATEQTLNPAFNPQVQFQHTQTNLANQWNAANRYPVTSSLANCVKPKFRRLCKIIIRGTIHKINMTNPGFLEDKYHHSIYHKFTIHAISK